MEEALRKRIKEVLKAFNETQNSLSNGDSALQNRLSRQLNQGSAITYQTIMLIVNKFPSVSVTWLVTGTGSMFVGDVIENNNTQRVDHIENSHVYQNQNGTQTVNADKSLEERIKALEDERQSMKEHIQRQEKLIDQLINK